MAPLLVIEIISTGFINGTDSANCDAIVCTGAGEVLEAGSIDFKTSSETLVESELKSIKESLLSLPRVGCGLLKAQTVCRS